MKKIKNEQRYDVIARVDFSTREMGELIIAHPNKKLNLLGATIKRLGRLVTFPQEETQEIGNG